MDILEYYGSQSSFTDPGKNVQMYEGLPVTVDEICELLNLLCLDSKERWQFPIQNERYLESNNRYVDEFLDAIKRLNKKAPLIDGRPEDQRMMTSVSHVATFCVSMLRHVGIPARKRIGFVKEDNYFTTYEIVEYFDKAEGAWKVADPNGKGLEFIPSYEAFENCRNKDCNVYRNEDNIGLDIVVDTVILDLAYVNKFEMLSWDRYGWMSRPLDDYSDLTWKILTQTAELLKDVNSNIEALQNLYESQEGLNVPRVIFCDAPLVPPHKAVIRELV